MNRLKMNATLVAVAILGVATIARGQLDLSWNTSSSSGGTMSSTAGTIQLAGTIGQYGVQPEPLTGGGFQLVGGFWTVSQVCNCPGDLNGDGREDGLDVQQFVNCMLGGGNCSCADVDDANGVDMGDVDAFAADLIAGTGCH